MDDVPLSPEAQELANLTFPAIREILVRASKVPVSILVWGPNPDSDHPVAQIRKELRNRLRKAGHAAFFSEELYDPSFKHSVRVQQIAQAQKVDLIISLPDSPGSIAEIHDFAVDRRVNSRLLIFLNEAYLDGYSAKSLTAMQSIRTCHIEKYHGPSDSESIYIIAEKEVEAVREAKFILGGVI
jgi:hypothetical protein